MDSGLSDQAAAVILPAASSRVVVAIHQQSPTVALSVSSWGSTAIREALPFVDTFNVKPQVLPATVGAPCLSSGVRLLLFLMHERCISMTMHTQELV
jgi:hypothetical protein